MVFASMPCRRFATNRRSTSSPRSPPAPTSSARPSAASSLVTVESDENLPRYVLPAEQGGYAADALWSDDFHHAVHALLTGERNGYYQDFADPALLPRALSQPYVFQGEPFRFWQGRPRGAPAAGVPLPSQIICIQNHDQVGNRAYGERLTTLVPAGARKLAAALLLLSPHTPLLFMGQEYDEPAPFQFFTSFDDPTIQKAVSRRPPARVRRISAGAMFPIRKTPQPLSARACSGCKARQNLEMLDWYRALLRLRREFVLPLLAPPRPSGVADHLLRVEIPAQSPRLRITARFPGEAEAAPGNREPLLTG